jgi:glyoxylase-like metal-dependent hydrolase (beta-lactamase superfamily II)
VPPRHGQETPHPPNTAEFGSVRPGGPAYEYELEDDLQVVKLSVGPFDNDVYLVANEGRAILVDGAAEPERILEEAASRSLEVTAIVQTHDHSDHTQALRDLVDALGVPVFAHPDDRMPVASEALADGDTLLVGSRTMRVMHTPGHTPGSTCYSVGGFLFSGDTLFPGGPGNTDGDPARFAEIMASLDRLFELPDDTRICPGHGVDSTIGRERPFVETWRARGW